MSSAGLSVRDWLSGSRLALLGIVTAVVGTFVSVLLVPYAFADDYTILWMEDTKQPTAQFGNSMLQLYAVTGRVLSGLMVDLIFPAAGTVADLRFVRLITVLAIAGVAVLLHFALMRSGIGSGVAALIAVFVCITPGFEVVGSWAVLVAAPFGAILAGLASIVAVSAVSGPRQLVLDRLVEATVLLVAALECYQPAAMFFWVFCAVALIGAREHAERAGRIVRMHLGVGVAGLIASYLVLKLSIHLLGRNIPGAARSSLTHDVVGKARWFVEGPLYHAASLFDISTSPWLTLLVVAAAGGGLLPYLVRRTAAPLLYVATALSLIPLSYLPNLLVVENQDTYRTQLGLSGLVALYAFLGGTVIWISLREWLRSRVGPRLLETFGCVAVGLGAAVVATTAAFAAANVTTLFAMPQLAELRLLRSELAALPVGTPRIAFVQTPFNAGATTAVYGDEFGIPSTASSWVIAPAVLLQLPGWGRLPSGQQQAVDILPVGTTTFPDNEPHIDLSGLQELR